MKMVFKNFKTCSEAFLIIMNMVPSYIYIYIYIKKIMYLYLYVYVFEYLYYISIKLDARFFIEIKCPEKLEEAAFWPEI